MITIYRASAHDTPLDDKSVHCVFTSPPYWGPRRYAGEQEIEWPAVSFAPMPGLPEIQVPGCDPSCDHVWGPEVPQDSRHQWTSANSGRKQSAVHAGASPAGRGAYCQQCGGWRGGLGLEPTVEMYIGHLILVMREVRRVLRDDGVVWVNLGDSYAGNSAGGFRPGAGRADGVVDERNQRNRNGNVCPPGLKPKDLVGVPWRFAFAAQADGWWLRKDIPWLKRNGMPGSQGDRPTTAKEDVFLLAKSQRYYYDQDGARVAPASYTRKGGSASYTANGSATHGVGSKSLHQMSSAGRYRRDADWFLESVKRIARGGKGLLSDEAGEPLALVVNPAQYKGSHFAVFSPELVKPCVLASTSDRGCCPTCGAPWERVVERVPMIVRPGPSREERSEGGRLRTQINGTMVPAPSSRTTGWRPTCDHYDLAYLADFPRARSPRKRLQRAASGDWFRRVRRRPGKPEWPVEPCVVWDPFAGTGTTGRVAVKYGRRAILGEVSQVYIDQHIAQRVDHVQMEMAL